MRRTLDALKKIAVQITTATSVADVPGNTIDEVLCYIEDNLAIHAATADTATSAANADTATNAANADTATNAANAERALAASQITVEDVEISGTNGFTLIDSNDNYYRITVSTSGELVVTPV